MNFTYCFPTMQGERAEELIKDSEWRLSTYHLNDILQANYWKDGDNYLILFLLEGQ